ncbi:unnamed protein product [Darwinula stevensoni]|uniref:Uncharacterized protein n=1 Tax=Darwinula stevensoni TaxID=69355 RepID=A0A7R9ADX0_9CRUS|nr:unnamed protein product [Darwinula stevensoni]CAG0901467.1 unnamed protein product [Darwinula stevensoni]
MYPFKGVELEQLWSSTTSSLVRGIIQCFKDAPRRKGFILLPFLFIGSLNSHSVSFLEGCEKIVKLHPQNLEVTAIEEIIDLAEEQIDIPEVPTSLPINLQGNNIGYVENDSENKVTVKHPPGSSPNTPTPQKNNQSIKRGRGEGRRKRGFGKEFPCHSSAKHLEKFVTEKEPEENAPPSVTPPVQAPLHCIEGDSDIFIQFQTISKPVSETHPKADVVTVKKHGRARKSKGCSKKSTTDLDRMITGEIEILQTDPAHEQEVVADSFHETNLHVLGIGDWAPSHIENENLGVVMSGRGETVEIQEKQSSQLKFMTSSNPSPKDSSVKKKKQNACHEENPRDLNARANDQLTLGAVVHKETGNIDSSWSFLMESLSDSDHDDGNENEQEKEGLTHQLQASLSQETEQIIARKAYANHNISLGDIMDFMIVNLNPLSPLSVSPAPSPGHPSLKRLNSEGFDFCSNEEDEAMTQEISLTSDISNEPLGSLHLHIGGKSSDFEGGVFSRIGDSFPTSEIAHEVPDTKALHLSMGITHVSSMLNVSHAFSHSQDTRIGKTSNEFGQTKGIMDQGSLFQVRDDTTGNKNKINEEAQRVSSGAAEKENSSEGITPMPEIVTSSSELEIQGSEKGERLLDYVKQTTSLDQSTQEGNGIENNASESFSKVTKDQQEETIDCLLESPSEVAKTGESASNTIPEPTGDQKEKVAHNESELSNKDCKKDAQRSDAEPYRIITKELRSSNSNTTLMPSKDQGEEQIPQVLPVESSSMKENVVRSNENTGKDTWHSHVRPIQMPTENKRSSLSPVKQYKDLRDEQIQGSSSVESLDVRETGVQRRQRRSSSESLIRPSVICCSIRSSPHSVRLSVIHSLRLGNSFDEKSTIDPADSGECIQKDAVLEASSGESVIMSQCLEKDKGSPLLDSNDKGPSNLDKLPTPAAASLPSSCSSCRSGEILDGTASLPVAKKKRSFSSQCSKFKLPSVQTSHDFAHEIFSGPNHHEVLFPKRRTSIASERPCANETKVPSPKTKLRALDQLTVDERVLGNSHEIANNDSAIAKFCKDLQRPSSSVNVGTSGENGEGTLKQIRIPSEKQNNTESQTQRRSHQMAFNKKLLHQRRSPRLSQPPPRESPSHRRSAHSLESSSASCDIQPSYKSTLPTDSQSPLTHGSSKPPSGCRSSHPLEFSDATPDLQSCHRCSSCKPLCNDSESPLPDISCLRQLLHPSMSPNGSPSQRRSSRLMSASYQHLIISSYQRVVPNESVLKADVSSWQPDPVVQKRNGKRTKCMTPPEGSEDQGFLVGAGKPLTSFAPYHCLSDNELDERDCPPKKKGRMETEMKKKRRAISDSKPEEKSVEPLDRDMHVGGEENPTEGEEKKKVFQRWFSDMNIVSVKSQESGRGQHIKELFGLDSGKPNALRKPIGRHEKHSETKKKQLQKKVQEMEQKQDCKKKQEQEFEKQLLHNLEHEQEEQQQQQPKKQEQEDKLHFSHKSLQEEEFQFEGNVNKKAQIKEKVNKCNVEYTENKGTLGIETEKDKQELLITSQNKCHQMSLQMAEEKLQEVAGQVMTQSLDGVSCPSSLTKKSGQDWVKRKCSRVLDLFGTDSENAVQVKVVQQKESMSQESHRSVLCDISSDSEVESLLESEDSEGTDADLVIDVPEDDSQLRKNVQLEDKGGQKGAKGKGEQYVGRWPETHLKNLNGENLLSLLSVFNSLKIPKAPYLNADQGKYLMKLFILIWEDPSWFLPKSLLFPTETIARYMVQFIVRHATMHPGDAGTGCQNVGLLRLARAAINLELQPRYCGLLNSLLFRLTCAIRNPTPWCSPAMNQPYPLTKEQVRLLLLYDFRIKKKAANSIADINTAFGPDTVSKSTAYDWTVMEPMHAILSFCYYSFRKIEEIGEERLLWLVEFETLLCKEKGWADIVAMQSLALLTSLARSPVRDLVPTLISHSLDIWPDVLTVPSSSPDSFHFGMLDYY